MSEMVLITIIDGCNVRWEEYWEASSLKNAPREVVEVYIRGFNNYNQIKKLIRKPVFLNLYPNVPTSSKEKHDWIWKQVVTFGKERFGKNDKKHGIIFGVKYYIFTRNEFKCENCKRLWYAVSRRESNLLNDKCQLDRTCIPCNRKFKTVPGYEKHYRVIHIEEQEQCQMV